MRYSDKALRILDVQLKLCLPIRTMGADQSVYYQLRNSRGKNANVSFPITAAKNPRMESHLTNTGDLAVYLGDGSIASTSPELHRL